MAAVSLPCCPWPWAKGHPEGSLLLAWDTTSGLSLEDPVTKTDNWRNNLKEWQKLNYDIYTLRQIRREVRNRWKRILEDLGFQKEADSLLSVTKLSTISDSKNTRKAREILLKLAEETNIFPTGWELSERYLFVVDRLIALDAAEEFFKIASRTYPKKPGAPCLADGQKGLHYLPFPSPWKRGWEAELEFFCWNSTANRSWTKAYRREWAS